MASALIGHSGFVGSTLLRQTHFDDRYRSTDIGQIRGKSFDTIVCAGAPAQKWIANKDPAGDLQRIEGLISHLETVDCKAFVLISTVDVFPDPTGVDEHTPLDVEGHHAYGANRRLLEQFVESRFPARLIARLAGLVGPGLRKNVIYDLLHGNNLAAVDSRGVFQFYPTVNLWFDIQAALAAGLNLVHLTAEPVSVAEIAAHGFGRTFEQHLESPPASYDFRTRHAGIFGGRGSYQYDKRDTLQAVRSYAQSEPAKPAGEIPR